MDTNIKIFKGFILIIAVCCSSFTCNKRFDCSKTIYSFEISIKAFPGNDSLNVNDTFWLKVEEPILLKDQRTMQDINYGGALNLGSSIGFQEIIGTTPEIISAANDFNYFIKKGVQTASPKIELYRDFLFAEYNGKYLFELGIIPKRKGVFRLVVSNAENVYTKSDKCTKSFFNINFKDTDQHFYFFPGGTGTPPGGGAYYFKVK
ncbi:MAG: hypothetical protein ACKVOW_05300 [Chitinophagaceae bacterium]